jgi:iron complex transport system ATP-binding protein
LKKRGENRKLCEAMIILEIQDLSAGYGNGDIVKNISFTLKKGEFLSILGRNGSGKSTLIKAIQGLLKDISGRILVDGKDISALKPHELAQKIAYVPQLFEVAFEFTVEEIILMGRYAHQGKFTGASAKDKRIIQEIMDLTETTPLKDKKIAHLSGGERQRTFIARALAQDTPLLFLDEPSAHLDINYQVEIYQILKRLQEEKNKTILAAEHNINLAVPYSKRLLFLKNGKIHSLGPPSELVTKQNILDVYHADVDVRKNLHSGLPEISLTFQKPE